MAKHLAVGAVGVGEQIDAGLDAVHRDVQVHGAAGLVLHRLGHEGRIDPVLQRHLAHDALEHQDLVGQSHRIAMQEVDFQLGGAALVDHGVDVELGGLGILVDQLDQVLVFGDGFEAVGLGRGLGAARTAGRRGQRQVGIGIEGRQVEFQFRGHDRLPAALAVERQDLLQHLAWRGGPGRTVGVVGVGEDIGRGRLEPGRDAQGFGVRPQHHVRIGIGLVLVIGVGVFPGDGHREHAGGQAQGAVQFGLKQLGRWQHLAPQDPVHVRDQALDLADAPLFDPFLHIGH